MVLAVLLHPAPGLCAQPLSHDAFIQELLGRSRRLEDARFRIPVSLWEMYVRETQLGPPKPPGAPVPYIAEEGIYRFDLEAKPVSALEVTIRLRVFHPDKCRDLGVLTGRKDWTDLAINGKPARLPKAKDWLRFSPPDPGVYVISARTGTARPVAVLPTVRTLVRFDAAKAWDVRVVKGGRLTGSAQAGTHGQIAVTPRPSLEVRWDPAMPEPDRPPRYALTGHVAWNLGPAGEQVAARLDVRIVGGRTDRIDLDLPPAADHVAVTGPDVRQTQVNGGTVAVFLRGKTGEHTRLRLDYELPAAQGDLRRFRRPEVRRGHWAGGTFVITNTAGGSELLPDRTTGLREVALSEIPAQAAAIMAGPAALAYQIAARDFAAQVEVVDLGEFALRESIVDLAHYELLFRQDGSILCKVNYEIRNRTRQFLRLDLPAGATVLMARVNEKSRPVSPIPAAPHACLLPLIRSKASVQGLVSFPVEIVLMCRAARLNQGHGEVELPLPRVDLPIAYAWCETYVPKGMAVRRWSGPLRSVEQYSSETAVAQLGYGRGELAEGYTAEKRQALVAMVPEAKPEPAKKPPPKPKPAPRRGGGIWSWLSPAPGKTQPLIAPARPERPATQPAAAEPTETPPPPPAQPQAVQPLLARNYYRSGQDFYAKGDYDNAAKALENVVNMAPKSTEAANARRLLGNIRLAQGKATLRTRAERAAGAKVRQEQAQVYQQEEQRQLQLLEGGVKAMREGQYGQAQAQFQVAESLGRQLLAQGAAAPEQRARIRKAQQALADIARAEEGKTRQLREQLKGYSATGKYEQALKAGRALRGRIAARGEQDAQLQTELEALAARAGKERARQHRATALRKEISSLRQADQAIGTRLSQLSRPAGGQGRGGARRTPAKEVGVPPAPATVSRLLVPSEKVTDQALAGLERQAGELRKAVDEKQKFLRTVQVQARQAAVASRTAPAPTPRPREILEKVVEKQHRLAELRKDLAQLRGTAAVASMEDRSGPLSAQVGKLAKQADEAEKARSQVQARLAASRQRLGPQHAETRRLQAELRKSHEASGQLRQRLEDRKAEARDLEGRLSRIKETQAAAARVEREIREDKRSIPYQRDRGVEGPGRIQLERMRDELTAFEQGESERAVVRLKNADPQALAETLGRLFRTTDEARGRGARPARIKADAKSNSLLITATATDMDRIRRLVAQLDQAATAETFVKLVPARPGGAAIDDLEGQRMIRRQETEVRYRQALDGVHGRLTKATKAGDFDKAKEDIRYAETLLETNRSLLSDGQYQAKKAEADRLGEELSRRRRQWMGRVTTVDGRAERVPTGTRAPVLGDIPAPAKEWGLTTGGTTTRPARPAVTMAYDVRNLIMTAPQFKAPRVDLRARTRPPRPEDADALFGEAGQKAAKDIEKTLRSTVAGLGKDAIRAQDGKLIVTAEAYRQDAVRDALAQLRSARGPQVWMGGQRIAAQRAKGMVLVTDGADQQAYVAELEPLVGGPSGFRPGVAAPDEGAVEAGRELKRFIDANYDWANRPPSKPVAGHVALAFSYADVLRKWRDNAGQKVVVNSTNVNVDAPAANSAGINFTEGRNDVSYAVVDEAQLRTLMELEGRRAPAAGRVSSNDRLQETIVGTDALLANDMFANATFADDRSNTLDVNGNGIVLSHDQYVLINNGSFLTAVRVGPMQHWQETPADVRFAEVPQDIELPRVGRMTKFEKSLIKPTDRLFVKASYVWKGEGR